MTRDTARHVRIEDVARAAGVSITTVSHALSGKGRLPAARREQVRAVARGLGYSPNPAAKSLASGKTGLVAVVVSAPGNASIPFTEIDYYVKLINEATAHAIERGYGVVLAPSTAGAETWERIPLDGVIVIDPARDDAAVAGLRARDVPMVFVGRDPCGDASDIVVENDRRTATRMVLNHLIAAGAAHTGILTLSTYESFTEDCLAEYSAWCAERRTQPLLHIASGDSTAGLHVFREAAEDFLLREDRPEGVFCLYERLAVELLRAAHDHNIRVPQELKVVSINEMGLAETTEPHLTELEINQGLLGATAAALLADVLGDRDVSSEQDIPTRLIARASTLGREG
ncbi:MAG: LacI family transcriptional regulator [Actinomycetota bacterium]|nr:LacI family transcriptional regulator [Actinomycetota bacterium]